MTPEMVEAMRDTLGLNDPAFIRYFRWLGGILTGNMGYSLVSGVSISQLILARLPATLEITMLGFAVDRKSVV